MGQKYAQGDAKGNITAYFDDSINSAAQIGTAIQLTDAQWQDSAANPGKYIIGAGAFMLAPPPTTVQLNAQAWAAYQARAKAALESSDTTMHRVTEAVVLAKTTLTAADVAAFVQWRASLRAILSQTQPATVPTSLPTKPAYPSGT